VNYRAGGVSFRDSLYTLCKESSNVRRSISGMSFAAGSCHWIKSLRSAAVNEQFDTVTELGVIRRQKHATLATSRFPMRPSGQSDTILAITSADCRFASGVLIGPGLTEFERYDGP